MGVVTQARIGALPMEFESDEDITVGETESPVLLLAPGHSSFDVWFDLPGAWSALCTLRAYAVVGSIRTLVATVRLGSLDVDNASERATGVAMTVRGRPAESFEITAQVDDGEALEGGRFFALAWSSTHAGRTVLQGPGTQGCGSRYAAATDAIASETSGTQTIAYLSHRAGLQRVEIDRIVVSYAGAGGGGALALRGATLSGEDASPGGSPISATPGLDPPEPRSASVLVEAPTNPPTAERDRFCIPLVGSSSGIFEWNARTGGGPIVLRSDVYGGFAVRTEIEVELDDPMMFAVTIYWREIAEAERGLAHYGFLYEWRADRGLVLSGSDVTSWTDQISDAVLTGGPAAGLAKPTLTSDGGAPCLSFTVSGANAMASVGEFWGPTSDYTIVMVLRTETSSWDGFPLAFVDNDNHFRTLLRKAYTYSWLHYRQENTGGGYLEAGVYEPGSDWKIAVLRRRASGIDVSVEDAVDDASGASAASTHLRMQVGYFTSIPSYQRYCNMDVRHIAIARRYLEDDECAAVAALLQRMWPDLP